MAEYNRWKVAMDIQDASNIRAVAREFVKIVDDANGARDDAAVILLVSKIVSMVPIEATFSAAYVQARRRAQQAGYAPSRMTRIMYDEAVAARCCDLWQQEIKA